MAFKVNTGTASVNAVDAVTSNIWQCRVCNQWTPFDATHTCPEGYSYRANSAMMERIAKALEAIVEHLAKKEAVCICKQCGDSVLWVNLACPIHGDK